MVYFNPFIFIHESIFVIDVLTTFLGGNIFDMLLSMKGQKALGFHKKKILICVPKINEGLTGLE